MYKHRHQFIEIEGAYARGDAAYKTKAEYFSLYPGSNADNVLCSICDFSCYGCVSLLLIFWL